MRINGKEVEPQLDHLDSWVNNHFKLPEKIDIKTKAAIESLWLRDAKKEFASVPHLTDWADLLKSSDPVELKLKQQIIPFH